jgi:hypothetical protein
VSYSYKQTKFICLVCPLSKLPLFGLLNIYNLPLHCQSAFTIKCRLFSRKEQLAKRNKATLISLWSQERATSSVIGGDFAYFVWCGEPWYKDMLICCLILQLVKLMTILMIYSCVSFFYLVILN